MVLCKHDFFPFTEDNDAACSRHRMADVQNRCCGQHVLLLRSPEKQRVALQSKIGAGCQTDSAVQRRRLSDEKSSSSWGFLRA